MMDQDQVAPYSPYSEPERFIAWCRDQITSEKLQQQLLQFMRDENIEGALLLKGLPIDSVLPETPINGKEPKKKTYISETILAYAGSILGEQIGYKQEKKGTLFHQITPTNGEELQQSSEGSKISLKLHTERCFHPYLPDYIILYCLRSDVRRMAKTTFVGIREVLPLLSIETQEILFQPLFRTGIDYSFGNTDSIKANGPILSVLHGNRDDPNIRFDMDLMIGLTKESQKALDELSELLTSHLHEVVLCPGDMLILDNHKSAHGRSTFSPTYSTTERWLQRVYIIKNLTASAQDRPNNGRIITTEF